MVSQTRPFSAVVAVYVSTTVVWTSYALLSVSLPFRFQSLGLSVVQYGVAVGAFAFGMLLTETFWGVFAFRIGHLRTVLALGVAVLALYVVVDLSTTFLELTLALAIFGALIIFPVPLFRWMAMIAGGPGTEGTGTGRYGLFFGAGTVIGSAFSPFLYETFGFGTLTVVILGTYAVGLGVMAALPWKEIRLPRSEPGTVSLIRRVLRVPFLFAAGLVVLAYLSFSLIINFLQIYSVVSFHGSPADAGYVIGLARATLLVAGFLLGATVDRFRPLRSVPPGFLLVAIGALGTLFSTSYGEMVASTVVFASGFGWLTASLLPLALEKTPAPLQGTAVGVFGSFEDLGLLAGPVLISGAYSAYGVNAMFILVALVAIAGALLSLLAQAGRRKTGPSAARPALGRGGG